jgi:hypothetical protein
VRDPNEHVIRFGHGIPVREPNMKIERVALEVRIEKRLAALLEDLAQHKNMTVGEMLEEMALHSFEKLSSGGVASPHTERTQRYVQDLKKKHCIDYDCHAIGLWRPVFRQEHRLHESNQESGEAGETAGPIPITYLFGVPIEKPA